MKRRRRAVEVLPSGLSGFRFPRSVILLAVRRHLRHAVEVTIDKVAAYQSVNDLPEPQAFQHHQARRQPLRGRRRSAPGPAAADAEPKTDRRPRRTLPATRSYRSRAFDEGMTSWESTKDPAGGCSLRSTSSNTRSDYGHQVAARRPHACRIAQRNNAAWACPTPMRLTVGGASAMSTFEKPRPRSRNGRHCWSSGTYASPPVCTEHFRTRPGHCWRWQ